MQDEVFSSCRFSESTDKIQVLYIAAVTGEHSDEMLSSQFLVEVFVVYITV